MDLEWIFESSEQLEGSRTAILKDLGYAIPEVRYDFFKEHVLPPLPPNLSLGKVLSKLRKRGHIADARWTTFPRDPYTYAKKSSGFVANDESEEIHEKEVFAKLSNVIGAIEECAVDGRRKKRRSTLLYESMPDSAPLCCFGEKAGRPDAYFVFGQRFQPDGEDGRRLWRDLATPGVFKLRDTRDNLQDDVKKICWSMYQILLEDARRRFVFAFTIENTSMRIWMGNRSKVIVSQPFNFITEHEKVVYFFLSQSHAKEADLGIDTTMTIVSANDFDVPVYDIKVRAVTNQGRRKPMSRELTFRTTRLLNYDGAKTFRGSGTRVWEVIPVIHNVAYPNKPSVMKDYWVDCDRPREGDIREEILNDPDIDDAYKAELEALFLTPIARGDVYIADANDGQEQLDGTRSLITRGEDIPEDATIFSLRVSAPQTYSSSHGETPSGVACGTQPSEDEDTMSGSEDNDAGQSGDTGQDTHEEPQEKIITYCDKIHYRIVFAEKCEPISQVRSLHRVFTALLSISSGLPLMHSCGPGWVHRDISAGNILLLPGTNIAKLSDLEYAKRLDDRTEHTMRTGTLDSMAVEVYCGEYLFHEDTEQEAEEEGDTRDLKAIIAFRQQLAKGNLSPGSASDTSKSNDASSLTPQDFLYNPVHDLESLWWIALYFVMNKETALSPQTPRPRDSAKARSQDPVYAKLTEGQRDYARSLFFGPEARNLAMRSNGNTRFDQHLRALPSHLSTISSALIKLRKALCNQYKKIEKPGFVIDKTACGSLYGLFMDTFKKIVQSLAEQDIVVAPLKPSAHGKSCKGATQVSDLGSEAVARTPSRSTKRKRSTQDSPSPSKRRQKAVGGSKGSGAGRVATAKASKHKDRRRV